MEQAYARLALHRLAQFAQSVDTSAWTEEERELWQVTAQ